MVRALAGFFGTVSTSYFLLEDGLFLRSCQGSIFSLLLGGLGRRGRRRRGLLSCESVELERKSRMLNFMPFGEGQSPFLKGLMS